MSASSTAISITPVSYILQSMKRYVDLLSSYYLRVLFNRAFIILYRYNSTDYAFSTNTILKATNQHHISVHSTTINTTPVSYAIVTIHHSLKLVSRQTPKHTSSSSRFFQPTPVPLTCPGALSASAKGIIRFSVDEGGGQNSRCAISTCVYFALASVSRDVTRYLRARVCVCVCRVFCKSKPRLIIQRGARRNLRRSAILHRVVWCEIIRAR